MKNILLISLTIILISSLFVISAISDDILNKQSYELLNNDICYKIIYEGQKDLLKKELIDLNLLILSLKELEILKNSIYAQYGLTFKNTDLTNTFKKFNWYFPSKDSVDKLLTNTDKKNLDKISQFMPPLINKELDKVKLIGVWHELPMLPAGWADKIIFFNNNTFRYDFNEMDQIKRIISMSGYYNIFLNRLTLYAIKRKIIRGGTIIKNNDFYEFKNAITIDETLTAPIIYTFPIGTISYDKENLKDSIKIGTRSFWKFSSNPK